MMFNFIIEDSQEGFTLFLCEYTKDDKGNNYKITHDEVFTSRNYPFVNAKLNACIASIDYNLYEKEYDEIVNGLRQVRFKPIKTAWEFKQERDSI